MVKELGNKTSCKLCRFWAAEPGGGPNEGWTSFNSPIFLGFRPATKPPPRPSGPVAYKAYTASSSSQGRFCMGLYAVYALVCGVESCIQSAQPSARAAVDTAPCCRPRTSCRVPFGAQRGAPRHLSLFITRCTTPVITVHRRASVVRARRRVQQGQLPASPAERRRHHSRCASSTSHPFACPLRLSSFTRRALAAAPSHVAVHGARV